jgi:hypothetical protein
MINPLPKIIWINRRIFWRFTGMALPPFGIILSTQASNLAQVLMHEWTHFLQAEELWYIGFWIVYAVLWLAYGYWNHPMEREARENKYDPAYNSHREKMAWRKYMDKPWWNKTI